MYIFVYKTHNATLAVVAQRGSLGLDPEKRIGILIGMRHLKNWGSGWYTQLKDLWKVGPNPARPQ
jgi:hypothetical protein